MIQSLQFTNEDLDSPAKAQFALKLNEMIAKINELDERTTTKQVHDNQPEYSTIPAVTQGFNNLLL